MPVSAACLSHRIGYPFLCLKTVLLIPAATSIIVATVIVGNCTRVLSRRNSSARPALYARVGFALHYCGGIYLYIRWRKWRPTGREPGRGMLASASQEDYKQCGQ